MKLIQLSIVLLLCIAIVSSQRLTSGSAFRRKQGALNQRLHTLKLFQTARAKSSDTYMTQKLDHFQPTDLRTWKQRYFVNTDSWNANGKKPIVFFILGGEGPMSSKYVEDYFVVSSLAKKYGALVVSVEHRFYGASNPLPTLNNDALKYLSSQQALADFANARRFFAQKYFGDNSTEDVKFVAFGGSYSGNLASWLVQKYGHLFVGSIAASAPVEATVPFSEYMDVVQNSLGEQCASQIAQATRELEGLTQSEHGRQTIGTKFNLCSPVSQNSTNDLAMFFSSLTDPVCEVVQYNLDNKPGLTSIPQICEAMDKEPNKVDGYANIVKMVNGGGCVETRFDSFMKAMTNTLTFDQGNDFAAMRSWTYQTCTEFGYYQFTNPKKKQPFSRALDLQWFTQQCKLAFNVDPTTLQASIDNTNMYYGSRNPAYNPNVFFSYGTIDPWHYLHVNNGDKHFIEGTAHCAILYPESENDLPELKKVRGLMVEHIDKLLK